MASVKQLSERKFKITISNGYRPNGKKICKAKTITVPNSVKPRGIPQYVAHEAEELERLVKSGFAEDRDTTFESYAARWLERQVKYAPGTLASYRRMLERVYPYIGAIKLGELRPMALENLLIELRKRTHQGKPIQEATVQKYLTVVSAVLSDAKRNEIISKNPARMIDLPRNGGNSSSLQTSRPSTSSTPWPRSTSSTTPSTSWRSTPAAAGASCAPCGGATSPLWTTTPGTWWCPAPAAWCRGKAWWRGLPKMAAAGP